MFDVHTEIDLENMHCFGNEEGKNSNIFLANDKQLDHQFIVKRILKENIFNDSNERSENVLFLESSILYKISHPNITEIQYASFDNQYVYMVMPYYENGSIQSLLNKRNLTVREFIKYTLDFLCGLLFVHSNKLVHFDIKPTNILINNNGKASLTDFGLSKYTSRLTELAEPNKLYTLHFPPEYFKSTKMSFQSDIYQVGLTMYRMINGNFIWDEQCSKIDKKKIISGQFPNRNYYLPHIPSKIKKIINKCLCVDLNKRYSSVLNIINDLSNIEGELDWEYKMISPQKYEWKLKGEKVNTHIFLTQNENFYDILTQKINPITNRTSKILKMCKSNLTKENAYKTISEFTQ